MDRRYGNQNARLINTQHFRAYLLKENRHNDCQNRTEYDKCQIIAKCIAEDYKGVTCLKKIGEVIQTHPRAFKNTDCIVDFLKCKGQAEHRQIIVDDKIKKTGNHQKIQREIACKAAFFLNFPLSILTCRI